MEKSLYSEIFDIYIYSRHFQKPQYIFFLDEETILDLMDRLEIDVETMKLWNRKADLRGNLTAAKDSIRNRMIYTANGNSFPFNPKTLEIDPDQIDTTRTEEFEKNTIITIVGFPLTNLQLEVLLDLRKREKNGSRSPEKFIHVEGPIALTEIVVRGYGPKRGSRNTPEKHSFARQFYLISDYHLHLSKCFNSNEKTVNIVDFLERVMNADPEFTDPRVRNEPIDFFLEVSHPGDLMRDLKQYAFAEPKKAGEKTPEKKESTSYLLDIRRALYNCFQHSKKSCKDKFNRYHWSDSRFRGIFREWLDFVQEYIGLLRFVLMSNKLARQEAGKKLVYQMLEDADILMNKTPTEIDDLFRIAKITKQIDNISYPDLARKIKSYYSTLFSTKWIGVKKKFKELNLRLKKTIMQQEHPEDMIDDALKLALEILFAISYLMDAYVIARSFREFKKPGKEGAPLKNIIIYAGDAHIETMVTLLKDLGEVEDDKKDERQNTRSETMQVDFQCLEVKVPLFVL